MTTRLLANNEIQKALQDLPSWRREGDKLVWEHRFSDFTEAFSFMTRVAFHAEKIDHHPDWENVYNRIKIQLSTHDAGGITEKDLQLARIIQKIVRESLTLP